jgi:hypothetical protein
MPAQSARSSDEPIRHHASHHDEAEHARPQVPPAPTVVQTVVRTVAQGQIQTNQEKAMTGIAVGPNQAMAKLAAISAAM